MSDRAPFLVDDADVPALRQAVCDIGGSGYYEAAVRERLGLGDMCDLHWRNLSVYRNEPRRGCIG